MYCKNLERNIEDANALTGPQKEFFFKNATLIIKTKINNHPIETEADKVYLSYLFSLLLLLGSQEILSKS
ncbi:MAG: hypothetical protein BM556_00650 [Bacteriovorax sp. MedPE-SWde]|nr:MAG: hypothetical protein BM556_00650 [Bacteriovorax sp. MedPE-SWde]